MFIDNQHSGFDLDRNYSAVAWDETDGFDDLHCWIWGC